MSCYPATRWTRTQMALSAAAKAVMEAQCCLEQWTAATRARAQGVLQTYVNMPELNN